MLHFNLKARVSSNKSVKTIRDYSRADIRSITEEMERFVGEFMANFEERSIQENWSIFKNKLLYLVERYVPQRNVRTNPRSPWFNAALRRLRNKKKRLFRSAKRVDRPDRWSQYQNANAEYLREVSNAKNAYFNVTLPSFLQNNPRKFWSIVNGNKNKIVQLTHCGVPVPNNECCKLLNDAFCSVFLHRFSSCVPTAPSHNFFPMDYIVIDWVGVRKLISNLNMSSSAGPDGINSKILKCTELYSSLILSKIFHQSLQCSSLPGDWKKGKVVPVHKSGNTNSPENYRPISLTSIPCKMLEHIIYTHLISFLEENSFFNNCQYGFRKTVSCETQLLSFTNDLFVNTDQGFDTDCIFLDFAKAFDTVSHDLLLLKLSKLSIDPNVLSWIKDFLSNRTQYVTANDCLSPSCAVTSGVPQGSVLGPLLFLIYINDLPDCITFSTIKLFADDCVLYLKISTPADILKLQTDLNNLSDWCNKWLMRLNVMKCKYMRISLRDNTANTCTYNLHGASLSQVDSYKYLGLHITKNLSWQVHVDYITNNSNRTLGYLRRNFSSAPSSLKLTLYKTLVRPKLEYACSIWDPSKHTLILALESIQNRAARFVFSNYSRHSSVTAMKKSLNLPDLSLRRKCSRLSLFHKIFHHNPILKEQLFTNPSYISSRLDHGLKVGVPSSRTNLYHDSFIPRTSRDWNHLPAAIASITDVNNFKVITHQEVL